MITFNQTQLTDNKLIWLLIIYFDDVTLKLAYKRPITLSGSLYDADVITLGSLSIGEKAINPRFGGLGNLGTLGFSISRNSSNVNVNNFIQDFYPATAGRYAVSRVVKLGVVYEGATNENQITYIDSDYYINSFSNDKSAINFTCYEISDIEAINIPYYKVQNEFNNYISYANKSQKTENAPLPLLYGDFSTNQALDRYWAQRMIKLAPAVMFDEKDLRYMFASHNCEATTYLPIIDENSIIFNRSGGWLVIYPAAVPYIPETLASTVALQDGNKVADERIYGSFFLCSGYIASSKSQITDVSALNTDRENQDDDYIDMAAESVLAIKIDAPISSDLGLPGIAQGDVKWTIWGDVATGEETTISVVYYVPDYGYSINSGIYDIDDANPGYVIYEMGDDTTNKQTALPWTFEELGNLEIVITVNAGVDNFRLRGIVLSVNNIIVKHIKPVKFEDIRRPVGLRKPGSSYLWQTKGNGIIIPNLGEGI